MQARKRTKKRKRTSERARKRERTPATNTRRPPSSHPDDDSTGAAMAVWDDGACHPQTAVPLPLHVESPTGSNTSNTSQESEFASSTSSRSNSNSPTATPVRIHLYTTTTTTAATTDPRTMPPCDVSSGIRSSSALTSAMKPEVDDNHDLESHCTTTTHPTSLRDAQNSSANAEGNSSHHRPLLFPARTLFSRLAAVVVHTTTTTNTDNEEDCCKEETNSLEEDYYTNPYISFSEMECCTGPERGLDAYADIDNADDADVFHVTTKPNLQKTPSSLFLRSRRLSSSASSSSSRMMSRGNNCETGEERRSSSTTTPRVGRRRHGTESLFNNSNANKTPCTATTTTTSPPSTSSYTTTTTNCTNTTGTPSTFTTPTPATTSNLLRPKNNTGGHHPPSPPLLSVVKRMASTKYIPWLLCLVGLTSVSMIVTTHHKISTDMEQQQHQYHHDRPDNHRHKDPVSVLFHRHGRHSSSSLHSKRDSKARTTTSSSTSVEQSAHQLVPLLRHAGSHAARLPERDASLPSSKNNNISMDMINPEDRNHDDPLKNHQHQHHRTVNLNALAQFPETEIPEQPHPVFASRPGKTDLTIAARLQHHHHHHGHLEGNTVDEEEPHHQQQQQQNYHHIRRFRNRGKSSTTQTRVHEHDRHHGHLGTIESSSARVYKIASSQGLLGFQAILPVNLPPAVDDLDEEPSFEFTDRDFYSSTPEHGTSAGRRIVALHGLSNDNALPPSRLVQQYPAEITDNTQLYGILDSGDEHISTLEMRAPYVQGECVPMQEWQTTFNPSCNGMHELDMPGMGDDRNEDDFKLFGMNGFWRNAWRYDSTGEHGSVSERDTVVLKTLKYVVYEIGTALEGRMETIIY